MENVQIQRAFVKADRISSTCSTINVSFLSFAHQRGGDLIRYTLLVNVSREGKTVPRERFYAKKSKATARKPQKNPQRVFSIVLDSARMHSFSSTSSGDAHARLENNKRNTALHAMRPNPMTNMEIFFQLRSCRHGRDIYDGSTRFTILGKQGIVIM